MTTRRARSPGSTKRRAEIGGWSEEVFYSLLQRARCLERLARPWAEVLEAYLASAAGPTRAEPLYEIARHYRLGGHHSLGYLFVKAAAAVPYPESDALFIAADVYRWRSVDERAVTAHYVQRYRNALDSCTSLLSTTALPEHERNRVADNRAFAVAQLGDTFLDFPASAIAGIGEPAERPTSTRRVTLTITTCKRPDLFERTMNSFCTAAKTSSRSTGGSASTTGPRVPTGPGCRTSTRSSSSCGSPGRSGHTVSMNRLAGLVDTPYWLHLEDDWQFLIPDQYVTRGNRDPRSRPGHRPGPLQRELRRDRGRS